VAWAGEHDATERRITDLYTRALDQLGNERPAVRLGGLYALERLGQDYPAHRQTIVDVLCAYLRMPSGAEGDSTPDQEAQVRRTAQQILLRHLRPADDAWPGSRIDLAGAQLTDFDAAGCAFGAVNFTRTVFRGTTRFTDAAFEGSVPLAGAWFAEGGMADFSRARFAAEVGAEGLTMACPARFDGTEFRSVTSFGAATFGAEASFRAATFHEPGTFDRVTFGGHASFRNATFERGSAFEHAHFESTVSYRSTRFVDMALFRWAVFEGDASFEHARFEAAVGFAKAVFRCGVTFDAAELHRDLDTVSRFDGVRAATAAPRAWPAGYREEPAEDGWVTVRPCGEQPAR
jgi:hypothetical protein